MCACLCLVFLVGRDRNEYDCLSQLFGLAMFIEDETQECLFCLDSYDMLSKLLNINSQVIVFV